MDTALNWRGDERHIWKNTLPSSSSLVLCVVCAENIGEGEEINQRRDGVDAELSEPPALVERRRSAVKISNPLRLPIRQQGQVRALEVERDSVKCFCVVWTTQLKSEAKAVD